MTRSLAWLLGSTVSLACSAGDGDAEPGSTSSTSTGGATIGATTTTVGGSSGAVDSTSGPAATTGNDGSSTDGGGSSETGIDPGVEGDGDYIIGPDYADAPEI